MDVTVRTGETEAVSGTPRHGSGQALLAALSLSSAQGEQACFLLHGAAETRDGKNLEEECAGILQQSLLGSEGDAWTRLDGTLKELNGLLKGFLVSGSLTDAHAVVALLEKDGALHVSAAGRGEAYLIRGGTASQITELSKGKPVPAFVHISSGSLEPGDSVIFSTQRLLRALTPAQLTQLSHTGGRFLDEVRAALEGEKEAAALATMQVSGGKDASALPFDEEERAAPPTRSRAGVVPRRPGRRSGNAAVAFLQAAKERVMPALASAGRTGASLGRRGATGVFKSSKGVKVLQEKGREFLDDLKNPRRKRRAHLLLLAAAVAAFLVIWLVVRLSTSSQRSKTRTELSQLMSEISDEIRTADNRRLTGDMDGANAILQRSAERAKQVLDNESGLFRAEALDLIDRIRSKHEEINNILRVPARVLVNMSSKSADVSAQGLIALGEGEFLVYDRQSIYRVLLNRLDDPKRVVEDDLVLQGTNFPRYKSQVFMTSGNSVVELSSNQFVPMKTEDPAGWITGKDIETYLRYLYVLSPERKQIYKYERLSNRYASPVEYNVNGDLTDAVDMAIDSSVYVLKQGGTVTRLLRGEVQPFSVRHAPEDVLKNATKLFKSPDGGNLYFLDPVKNRVIVVTDGGATGESSYVKQYILEGEQIGTLQDLVVDTEQAHAYILDEKRVYVVDLATK